jgi:signal transduction histidine kinase
MAGGRFSVESEPGAGTRVTLTVPAREEPDGADE